MIWNALTSEVPQSRAVFQQEHHSGRLAILFTTARTLYDKNGGKLGLPGMETTHIVLLDSAKGSKGQNVRSLPYPKRKGNLQKGASFKEDRRLQRAPCQVSMLAPWQKKLINARSGSIARHIRTPQHVLDGFPYLGTLNPLAHHCVGANRFVAFDLGSSECGVALQRSVDSCLQGERSRRTVQLSDRKAQMDEKHSETMAASSTPVNRAALVGFFEGSLRST